MVSAIRRRDWEPLRGGFAPASLKHGEDPAVRHEHPPTLRGGFAPASLKRIPPASWRSRASSSPGRIRPGLIEARCRRGCYGGAAIPSPGRIRPGLIEARPPRSAHETRPYSTLRGGFAPASLKRCRISWRLATCRASPGRIRPGLIEATPTLLAVARGGPLSGADSPRPH